LRFRNLRWQRSCQLDQMAAFHFHGLQFHQILNLLLHRAKQFIASAA